MVRDGTEKRGDQKTSAEGGIGKKKEREAAPLFRRGVRGPSKTFVRRKKEKKKKNAITRIFSKKEKKFSDPRDEAGAT